MRVKHFTCRPWKKPLPGQHSLHSIPFHWLTPVYANGLDSGGGKCIQRKEQTNPPTKQTQVPKAKKPKSKVRTAACLLAAPIWPQNPAATYKSFQSCQFPDSMYPIQTRPKKTSKNKPHRYLLRGRGERKNDFVPLSRQEMAISHANFRNTFSAWFYTFYPLIPSLVNSCLLREYLREHWKAEHLLELDYA